MIYFIQWKYGPHSKGLGFKGPKNILAVEPAGGAVQIIAANHNRVKMWFKEPNLWYEGYAECK